MNNSVNKEIYKDPIKISIILLSLIVFIMLILIVNNELRKRNDTAKGRLKKYVAISEFIFDSKNRRFIDIKFDKPIGKVENMEILGRDPAVLSPHLSGNWLWQNPNTLRFEPSRRFKNATDYKIKLLPEILLSYGVSLIGKSEFDFRTSNFIVVHTTLEELQDPDNKNSIFYTGTIEFSHVVDPKVLVRKVSLKKISSESDNKGVEIPIKLETNYWSSTVKWRSLPIEKKKNETKLVLDIVGDITPAEGNVPLGEDFSQEINVGSKENLN